MNSNNQGSDGKNVICLATNKGVLQDKYCNSQRGQEQTLSPVVDPDKQFQSFKDGIEDFDRQYSQFSSIEKVVDETQKQADALSKAMQEFD